MAEKGKVEKVYSLTPFGEEMSKIVRGFEQRIRIDALEELRVMVISKREQTTDDFGNIDQQIGAETALDEVIDLIAEAKKRAV